MELGAAASILTHIVITPCNGTPITADTIIIPLYIVTPTITIIYCVVGANAAIIVDVIVGANAAIAVVDDVVVVIGAVAAIIIVVVCIVAIVVVVIVICPTIPPLLGGILPTPPAPTRSRGAHILDLTLPRATGTAFFIGKGFIGREASTKVGGTLLLRQQTFKLFVALSNFTLFLFHFLFRLICF